MKDFGEANCANPECGKLFTKRASNGIYCGPACRTFIMNKRVLEKYHEKREARKNNTPRNCSKKSCNNKLSRYNTESICETCKTERLIKRLVRYGYSEAVLRNEWAE